MINELKLKDIPFSAYGSCLTIQKITRDFSDLIPKDANGAGFYVQTKSEEKFDPGYYLRALYEDDRYRLLYRLSFDGSFDGMEDEMYPERLIFTKQDQRMEVCFSAEDTLRFKGHCRQFEFFMSKREIIKYNAAMYFDERHIGLNTYTRKAIIYAKTGWLELDAPWGDNESNVYIRVIAHPDENGEMEFVYKDFRTEFARDYIESSMEDDAQRMRDSFEGFAASLGNCGRPDYAAAWRTAQFVLWSSVIAPNQLIRRNAVLADKDWNCEARHLDSQLLLWALSDGQPGLAWEQFMLFADQQDASGAMPAWIGTYKMNNRTVKMPIGGIVIGELLKKGSLDRQQQETAYEVLRKEAAFWTEMRDYDRDGLPEYCYPTECGENGCSVFDDSLWVETPDLAAYVILQYRTLSRLAESLGEDASQWEEAADALQEKLIALLWDGEAGRFVSRDAGSHTICGSSSLLHLFPLLLGDKLPEEVRSGLLNALQAPNGWICPAGVASEPLDSKDGDEEFFLRGCVWAPWVLLTVKALRDCGRKDLSAEIAEKFCRTVADQGFRERYRALDGKGIGGRANSAAAAVFMILMRDYMEEV